MYLKKSAKWAFKKVRPETFLLVHSEALPSMVPGQGGWGISHKRTNTDKVGGGGLTILAVLISNG